MVDTFIYNIGCRVFVYNLHRNTSVHMIVWYLYVFMISEGFGPVLKWTGPLSSKHSLCRAKLLQSHQGQCKSEFLSF